MNLKADAKWIQNQLETINTYNDTPEYGTTRVLFTETELACRAYVKGEMEKLGLVVTEDACGNIFGAWEGLEPELAPVWTGSHIDTVLNAGIFDGMAGVVAGMEAIRMLQNAGLRCRRTLIVVVYMSEEPTRFAYSCLGSRALCGNLDAEGMKQLFDKEGNSLYGLLEKLGYAPDKLETVVKKPGDVFATLELHVEQNNTLERAGKKIGIVEAICAPTNLLVTVNGVQSHAGGTNMVDRHDAYMAAAELSLKLEAIALEANKQSFTTGTVGIIKNIPGAENVIPGTTTFTIDIRGVDMALKDSVLEQLRAAAAEVAAKRGVEINLELRNHDLPAICNGKLQVLLKEACTEEEYMSTLSGPYHDSLYTARFAPMAMVFVPSKDGISHSPDEWTDFEDVARGAEVLAHAMYQAGNLDSLE